MGKYDPLEKYLANYGKEEIIMTFADIERIIGFSLPASAVNHAEWWANESKDSSFHSHAKAWRSAGYQVRANRPERKVVFFKANTATQAAAKAPDPRTNKLEKAYTRTNSRSPGRPAVRADENEKIMICGYPFRYIQQLIPDCIDGKAVKYYPQKNYNNVDHLPLLSDGHGAFCHFSVDAPAAAGVYLWVVDGEIIYIGKTVNLAKRFNMGYENISPRNCFVGGQSTNCKMNKVVMEYYEKCTPIDLYFYETADNKQVELILLRCCNTKYNVRNN